MSKIPVLVKGPAQINCGYGRHTIEIVRALNSDPLFEVFVENTRWGGCPPVSEDNADNRMVAELCKKFSQAQAAKFNAYELFFQVTIPNEFERRAKFNIGVTAGIETDRVAIEWIQKSNEMDLIMVPSQHSKNVFMRTQYEWLNQQTGERGVMKLDKPIAVVPEGFDGKLFRKMKPEEVKPQFELDTDFNFLTVGQWGHQTVGEDRKNIGLLVKLFIETFYGRKDVGLVLKVNMMNHSVTDYDTCIKRINEIKNPYDKDKIPPIYLLHANFTDEEMAQLYNHPKIKSYVSLTHGEGWGRPLLEAAACELPIVATNWSGHVDFLKKDLFSPVTYELQKIPASAVWKGVLTEDSQWANVSIEDASKRMAKMVSHNIKPRQWAKELSEIVHSSYENDVIQNNFLVAVKQFMINNQGKAPQNPEEEMSFHIDDPDAFNVLYTMPMSTGDVYVSTAVINGLKKSLPENAQIYFATQEKYFDVLKNNPDVYKVIPFREYMTQIDITEKVFDLVLTPNVATQYTFSNWVRRGQGRLLAQEFANHCQTELGDYFIDFDDSVYNDLVGKAGNYMTIHPGSGQGQWEARKYVDWQEVVNNLKEYVADLKIVQVGSADEKLLEGIDVDLRGKTSIQQLASVVKHSMLHLSIDTFTMHLAAGLETPFVALFGSSHAKSTGPWVKNGQTAKYVILETENRMGCSKACYKYQCEKNKELPCINYIDPLSVFDSCVKILRTYE